MPHRTTTLTPGGSLPFRDPPSDWGNVAVGSNGNSANLASGLLGASSFAPVVDYQQDYQSVSGFFFSDGDVGLVKATLTFQIAFQDGGAGSAILGGAFCGSTVELEVEQLTHFNGSSNGPMSALVDIGNSGSFSFLAGGSSGVEPQVTHGPVAQAPVAVSFTKPTGPMFWPFPIADLFRVTARLQTWASGGGFASADIATQISIGSIVVQS